MATENLLNWFITAYQGIFSLRHQSTIRSRPRKRDPTGKRMNALANAKQAHDRAAIKCPYSSYIPTNLIMRI